MQRIVVIVSLFAFLSANTAFGQLLRMPRLMHHYMEHVAIDQSTFLEFLSEHYVKNINHDDDKHHDHQNLPFKVLDGQTVQAAPLPPTQVIPIEIGPLELINPNKTSSQKQHFSNAHIASIWQPPRFN